MRDGRGTAFSSLLRPLSVFGACAILLLAGCASFPKPSSDNDSLFVLLSENPAPRSGPEKGGDTLRFQGPSSFSIRVGGEERRGYYIKVKPGRYSLAASDLIPSGSGPESSFEIPAGTVYLFSMKYTRVREPEERVRRLVPMAPEDQKNASALLTDWLDYETWFGRLVEGFGAYPPRLGEEEGNVEFGITSTPPGAQVTVDDQAWGTTPVTTMLHTGKHLLQLEIPGVALTKQFIDVQSKGEIDVSLPLLQAQEAKDLKDKSQRITILLTAFQNMGSAENDNLRSVFPQVIGGDLRGDSRIDLVDAGELVARGGGIPGKPDFAVANQKGIDLIVSGYYTARPDGLLVYAALYDVETELPRASIMYTGKAGLAMFDSVDAMATEFIAGIDRALPEVRLFEKGATVQTRLVSYEKKRSETTIIEKRQAMRSSLTFIEGPNVAVTGGLHVPAFPNALLAILPIGAIFDYTLNGPFSLMALFQPAVSFDSPGNPGIDQTASYVSVPYLDIPLKFGPEYTLFGYNVDLSFALLGEARFAQKWFDTGSGNGTVYKAVWTGALGSETTARLYLNSRISERPSFFFLGFNWFLVGVQTNIDFSSPQLSPLELSLSLGYGFRL